MRRICLVFLLPALAAAAVWPESFGAWKRTHTAAAAPSDQPVWDEYGLKEAETATFENGARSIVATGYRLADPTGAMAAFEWQRPAGFTASAVAPHAVQGKGMLVAHGNFLFSFADYQLSGEEFAALTGSLRNLDTTTLPAFTSFLPEANLVPGSQRYLLGPVSLEKFYPGIPPSVAGFSMGAEAQVASFRSPRGELRLVLFNYPTPQIAMQKVQDFQTVTGVVVKRSGPLVAAVLSPPDPDAAERLLGEIRYEAQITLHERSLTRRDNIGDLIVNAFVLIGILLCFSAVAGFTMGGFRLFRRWRRHGEEPEAMIALHLERR